MIINIMSTLYQILLNIPHEIASSFEFQYKLASQCDFLIPEKLFLLLCNFLKPGRFVSSLQGKIIETQIILGEKKRNYKMWHSAYSYCVAETTKCLAILGSNCNNFCTSGYIWGWFALFKLRN